MILSKNTKQGRELKQVANSFKGSTLVEKNTGTRGRVNRSQIATGRGQGTECSEDDSAVSIICMIIIRNYITIHARWLHFATVISINMYAFSIACRFQLGKMGFQ